VSRETSPPSECPSCDARLVGYDWQEYITHVAEHGDLSGRIARRMVGHRDGEEA
jgi:uncharacterized C2H2 Zn-finger protein